MLILNQLKQEVQTYSFNLLRTTFFCKEALACAFSSACVFLVLSDRSMKHTCPVRVTCKEVEIALTVLVVHSTKQLSSLSLT